jgi:thiamine biosynthesis lipoprotein
MDNFKLKKKLFSGTIEIFIYETKSKKNNLINDAYNEGKRLEKIFNFFDKQSELSILNKKRKMKVSEDILKVLKLAIKLAKETCGEYDPSLGKNFLKIKNNKKLKKLGCSYRDIKINGSLVELSHQDILIDLGSIAKGYITDEIAEFLKSNKVSRGAINSRGDILVWGNKKSIIKIKNPKKKKNAIISLYVKNSGIATSGEYNQRHLLNKKNYSSITVIAPTLMEADLYATVFSLVDKNKIKEILKKKKRIKVMGIYDNLNRETYNKFNEVLLNG